MRKLLPRVVEIQKIGSEAVQLILQVDKDIEYFKGHFDQFPILPGVALISWVSYFAEEQLGIKANCIGLDVIKFLKPVVPDLQIRLAIDYRSEKKSLDFVCSTETEKIASGRLLLEVP